MVGLKLTVVRVVCISRQLEEHTLAAIDLIEESTATIMEKKQCAYRRFFERILN